MLLQAAPAAVRQAERPQQKVSSGQRGKEQARGKQASRPARRRQAGGNAKGRQRAGAAAAAPCTHSAMCRPSACVTSPSLRSSGKMEGLGAAAATVGIVDAPATVPAGTAVAGGGGVRRRGPLHMPAPKRPAHLGRAPAAPAAAASAAAVSACARAPAARQVAAMSAAAARRARAAATGRPKRCGRAARSITQPAARRILPRRSEGRRARARPGASPANVAARCYPACVRGAAHRSTRRRWGRLLNRGPAQGAQERRGAAACARLAARLQGWARLRVLGRGCAYWRGGA